MTEKLAKLLHVKSIVTLVLTGVFAYLAASGQVGPDLFLTVYAVIISFYFGTQHERGKTTDTPDTTTTDTQEVETK